MPRDHNSLHFQTLHIFWAYGHPAEVGEHVGQHHETAPKAPLRIGGQEHEGSGSHVETLENLSHSVLDGIFRDHREGGWLRSSPCPQYRRDEIRQQLWNWVG